MHRRRFLAALPGIAVAGCLSGDDGRSAPDDPAPPDGVELVEFTRPEYVRAARETRLGAVVRNAADATRSGTAALELSPTGEHWRRLVETTYELAPGEQAIVETTAVTHFVGSLHLRLAPFERTTRVDATDPSLAYGATYALPNGIDLAVADPTPIDVYEYEADGTRRTETPRDGTNWYLATVTATNGGDGAAIAPYRTAFGMLGYDWREAVRYRAGDAYEGGELAPGDSRTGDVLFGTHHRSDEQPIRLRHPYEDGTIGATWTPP